jgi:UDP-N-acetylmuramoyl-tripeptide--D-alanyl-D-alanine ligase
MKKIISFLVLRYLRFIAKLQLKKIKPKIIGVTGSSGKTTTSEAIYAIFKTKFKTKISRKANSESGIPLNILDLKPNSYSAFDWLRLILLAPIALIFNHKKYKFYIAEMGIDSNKPPKNMRYLLSIIRPHTGVFLNASAVHSENFKDVSEITSEKGKLITSLPENGLAILNADLDNVINFKHQTKARVISFGKKGDLTIKKISQTLDGTYLEFQYQDQSEQVFFKNQVLPDHFASSFAAALAVAVSYDFELKTACKALERNYKLPPGRSSLIKGINNSYILDSSYNASAQPTIDLINLTKKIAKNRALLLLGDMRELGKLTKEEHVRVAKEITKKFEIICLVGPLTKKYLYPMLINKGLKAFWFSNTEEAGEYLTSMLNKDDFLLIKSSQNTLFLETVVEKLMANPNEADKLLCRRGEWWDRVRKKK